MAKSPRCWFCNAMARSVPIPAASLSERVTSNQLTEIPSVEIPGVQHPSAADVYQAVRARFAQDAGTGVWRRLTNVWLEPPNPFNPRARRSRRDATVVTMLILVVLGLVLYCNMTAVLE
jgi:hypothetical protein